MRWFRIVSVDHHHLRQGCHHQNHAGDACKHQQHAQYQVVVLVIQTRNEVFSISLLQHRAQQQEWFSSTPACSNSIDNPLHHWLMSHGVEHLWQVAIHARAFAGSENDCCSDWIVLSGCLCLCSSLYRKLARQDLNLECLDQNQVCYRLHHGPKF